MPTERFKQLRKRELSGLLDRSSVSKIWRNIVRGQLRTLDIKDLFDHYDFNYNIEDRATALKSDILSGTYKVSAPLIYRVEKKYGICRHLVIPQPVDALLLQVLVESVAPQIIKKQPSPNAFYSRDKHNVGHPHEAAEYGASFREQWKLLQKKIYKFSEEKKLLVVTDLSNYYDSIHLEELRKVFVSYVEINEVVVDLLFKVLEGISWVPDYLPYSKRGIPTANLEAIRLLAHSFLFEVDAVLRKKTGSSFARWMDDITFGMNTRAEAIEALSAVSDMLKSRGMALNLAKTHIYSIADARHNFQIDQNLYLDSLEGVESDPTGRRTADKAVLAKFKSHLRDKSPKSWDKVAKRYITVFGRLKSKKLIGLLPKLYIVCPALRSNLLLYLGNLGYSTGTANAVKNVLRRLDVFDDLSLFQISSLIASWEIPRSRTALENLRIFESMLARLSALKKESSGFYSLLWFKAKYAPASELLGFLKKYKNIWIQDSFLRRQATICLARLLPLKKGGAGAMLADQALSGVQGTVSVANQISQFSSIAVLENKVRLYLFPTVKPRVYPQGKFMVLCAVLNSKDIRKMQDVRRLILEFITDPTYRAWLRADYAIS